MKKVFVNLSTAGDHKLDTSVVNGVSVQRTYFIGGGVKTAKIMRPEFVGADGSYEMVADEDVAYWQAQKTQLAHSDIAISITPLDITLSNATVRDNLASGGTVGTLATVDPKGTFVYSLVTGTGSDDNASFAIVGNALKTGIALDHTLKAAYTVRVCTTQEDGLTFEKAFAITVTA